MRTPLKHSPRPHRSFPVLAVVLAAIMSLSVPAWPAEKTNVLLLCIDDLRPELKCFGVEYIHSPNIDRLAASGRAFTRHFVQAPTCGASRYSLLTGRYGPRGNGALFQRARQMDAAPASMPEHFRKHGYTAVSIGKVSHHPGGRGGPDWDDGKILEMPRSWDRHLLPAGAWQHPRGAMHGLARGEIRKKAGDMDVYQLAEGDDSIYPDGLIVDASLKELERLAREDRPFFLAVGIIRPHLPFGAPAKYMKHYAGIELPPIPHPDKPAGKTTWHGSGEFMKYNRWGKDPRRDRTFADAVRRHYAACVTYADAQVGRVLSKLESLQLAGNTVVVLWGDHGWHLGEHAIWGKHSLFEESLRSPLIIKAPQVLQPGAKSDAIIEAMDLFPTLCELTSLPVPAHVQGRSLLPQLRDSRAKGRVAVAYAGRSETLRSDRYRLIRHRPKDGGKGELYYELYDHQSSERETHNIAAENPKVVERLGRRLDERLGK